MVLKCRFMTSFPRDSKPVCLGRRSRICICNTQSHPRVTPVRLQCRPFFEKYQFKMTNAGFIASKTIELSDEMPILDHLSHTLYYLTTVSRQTAFKGLLVLQVYSFQALFFSCWSLKFGL